MGIRGVVELDFKTIKLCLIETYKGHLDAHKMFEYTLYYGKTDTRTTVSVCSNRKEERNSTASQRRRQTSENLATVGKVMRAGHRQGGGVGRGSSGVVGAISIVLSEFF